MFNPKFINVMEINNKILEALSKIPKLVELAERLMAESKIKSDILAKAVQNKVQAEIPPEEIDAFTKAVTESVRRTPCASPNLSQVSAEIANKVAAEIRDMVYADVKAATSAAIKDTPHVTRKEVTLLPPWESTQFAEDSTRRLNHVLLALCIVFMVAFGLCAWGHFGSDAYVGKQYMKICTSEYATRAEKEMLWKDTSTVSVVPDEYDKLPKLVRQKIRRNKEILRQREKEAKANKGEYSTPVPLER